MEKRSVKWKDTCCLAQEPSADGKEARLASVGVQEGFMEEVRVV